MWGDGTGITREHIRLLGNTSLKELCLDSNRISHFERGALSSLPRSLQQLHLADNMLQAGWYMIEFLSLRNMRFADLSFLFKNFHSYLPMFRTPCNDTRRVPCATEMINNQKTNPALHTVSIKTSTSNDNTSRTLPTASNSMINGNRAFPNFRPRPLTYIFYMPPNLLTVKVEYSAIHDKAPDAFIIYKSRVLKSLYLAGNHFEYLIKNPFVIDTLAFLDISSNRIKYVADSYFHGLKGLQHLLISNNYLGPFVEKKQSENIFASQKRLLHIDLSANQIRSVTKRLFHHCSNLEHVDLHGNQLTGITFDFRHMIHLRLLNLSNNQIRSLTDENINDLDIISRHGNITIDMTRNRLLCDCSTLKFLKWMQSNLKIFRHHKMYICTFPNDTEQSLSEFHDVVQKLGLRM